MHNPRTSCSVRFTCFPGRLLLIDQFETRLPSDFEELVDDGVDVNLFSVVFGHSVNINYKFECTESVHLYIQN